MNERKRLGTSSPLSPHKPKHRKRGQQFITAYLSKRQRSVKEFLPKKRPDFCIFQFPKEDRICSLSRETNERQFLDTTSCLRKVGKDLNLCVERRKERQMGEDYFCGGLCAKLTPFAMLPFKPSTQALRRVFSFSSRLFRGLMAFSAPEVYFAVSKHPQSLGGETYA